MDALNPSTRQPIPGSPLPLVMPLPRAKTTPATAGRPPLTRPLRSFGWAFAGVLGLSLSLPPVGFYPLAWIGLVPLLVRWSEHASWRVCARETYALMLALSVSSGFWVLLNGDAGVALTGGLGLLLLPLPFVAAATLSGIVRRRFGLIIGLSAFVLGVLTTEYALVSLPTGVPWLLLGHTQVEGVAFAQMADVGGVLLLSLWVLLLNVAAFSTLPLIKAEAKRGAGAIDTLRRDVAWATSIGDSGIAVALVAVLIALPAAYGAAASGQETPVGYARVGIVQPGLAPQRWTAEAAGRVDLLANLSDRLLSHWTPADSSVTPELTRVSQPGRGATPVGLLIWPQGSLPWMGSDARETATLSRLSEWCRLRGVALITGSTTLAPLADGATADEDRPIRTAALRVAPNGEIERYDQMRRMPVADAPAQAGTERHLLPVGGARVAALLGFESLFGDHARRFALDGADMFVVLARSDRWGESSGPYQHLHATRLRAIETRRSVVVVSAGGLSAVVSPSGRIEQTSGWLEQNLVPTDVPLYRSSTFYMRHGDWVGRWALGGALLLSLAAAFSEFLLPRMRSRIA